MASGDKNIFRKWLPRTGLAALAAAAAFYFTPSALYSLSHESTDNAYVVGRIVPVSAEVKGKVVKVFVSDNQRVKAGDPILQIDRQEYENALAQMRDHAATLKARMTEIAASMDEKKKALSSLRAALEASVEGTRLAADELKREKELFSKGMVSRSQYQSFETRWAAAKAQKEAAAAKAAETKAELQTLEASIKTQGARIREAGAGVQMAGLDLERTLVTAPFSGRITRKSVLPGQYVNPGQPLLSVVDDSDVWVLANFKETQIDKIRAGQSVDIAVDSYPGLELKGRVESLQSGTGAVFSLLPPENATGNFVKVVQRIPVKIVFDSVPARALLPGMSVVPYVDISGPVRKAQARTGG